MELSKISFELYKNWVIQNEYITYRNISVPVIMQSHLWSLSAYLVRNKHLTKKYPFYHINMESFDINTLTKIFNVIRYSKYLTLIKPKNKKISYKPILLFHSDRLKSIANEISPIANFVGGPNNHKKAFLNLSVTREKRKIANEVATSLKGYYLTKGYDIPIKIIKKFKDIALYQLNLIDYYYNLLNLNNPKCVIIHGDNHPPYITLVLVCKNLGIKTLMISHGLDCEHYHLDKVYADYVAVWGKERIKRYAKVENEAIFCVTGNPEYDSINVSDNVSLRGDKLLWIGRPHSIDKCYSPFATPDDGKEILKSLINILEKHDLYRLVIKSHPFDDIDVYKSIIDKCVLSNRISFAKGDIYSELKDSAVVFAEDSTAAIEAMFLGKPIINVHFINDPPVLPLVEYSAALPGYSADELFQSFEEIISENFDLDALHQGQENFIQEFAYKLDGKSTERVVDFIEEIIEENSS